MTVSRWSDSGRLDCAVETAGGPQAFDAAVAAMLYNARCGDWPRCVCAGASPSTAAANYGLSWLDGRGGLRGFAVT